ncbi:Mechanosensitive ion channel protein 10 [Nosema granulosis]|uniref:Mechanosensitive ion channel protein 10 n=1 Tax=Nosema granulosis TaxID=83296 RepID=A0A9P6H2D8_9MICR|nr:Mechanosensitive ion channel protein 10 [Nosema granulosis]
MPETLNSTGIEILKNDFEDVPDFSIYVPNRRRYLISFLLLFIDALALYYLHFYSLLPILSGTDGSTDNLIWYKLLFCFCLFGYILLFLDILLVAVMRRMASSRHRHCLIRLIITKNTLYIKIVLSLLLSALLLIFYEHFFEPVKEQIDDVVVSNSIFMVENLAYIVLSVAVFLLVLLFKTLVVMALKYKMHFSHYRERIEINNRHNDVLYMINRMTGREMYSDVKQWATWVFNLLSNNRSVLTRSCCRHFFNEEDTEKIFAMFDTNSDGSVALDEFISVFFGVIREKYFLNEALMQKSSLLSKLSFVLSCIFIPIGVFLSSAILGSTLYLKNYVSAISGAVLSLSFIFSSIAGEIFRSLIFIFCVRPFEAGDILKIDDKIMTVKELGLLYTSFSIDSLTNYIQNIKLMDKYIVNYRLSDVEEKVYRYTFDLFQFKSKLENLKKEITLKLAEDTKKYTGQFEISNFKNIDNNVVSVDIKIHFKINFQYIRGLIKNEDEFLFILENILKELALKNH